MLETGRVRGQSMHHPRHCTVSGPSLMVLPVAADWETNDDDQPWIRELVSIMLAVYTY